MKAVPRRLLALCFVVALLGLAAGPLAGQQSSSGGAFSASDDGGERYGVAIVRDVMVPMRDGVRLATDLYIPARDGVALPGPWPTVVERTPYSKYRFYANAPDGNDYARNGYVMVVQDVRGKFDSEGVFSSYPQEGPDGYDTVEWIHEQPWSDGRIIATGSSYSHPRRRPSWCRTRRASWRPPSGSAPANYHEDGAWRGGAFLLSHNVNYVLRLAAEGHEAAKNPAVEAALQENRKIENSLRLMRLSPLSRGFSPIALTPSYDDWYQDWQNHELYDDYWQQMGNGVTKHFASAADVPILLIGEWYDAFLGGTLDQLAAYGEDRQSPVHLVISGGEHGNVYSLRTWSGDVDLGPESPIEVGVEMMKWFDQHVKGKDRGVKSGNLVRAFRIEGGRRGEERRRPAAGRRHLAGVHRVAAGRFQPRRLLPQRGRQHYHGRARGRLHHLYARSGQPGPLDRRPRQLGPPGAAPGRRTSAAASSCRTATTTCRCGCAPTCWRSRRRRWSRMSKSPARSWRACGCRRAPSTPTSS